jgi:protein-disulfide isomerase
VKVVEFSDFQCGFCGRFYANTLEPLTTRYGDLIQFVYRDYPIFGEPSVLSGMAAECAGDQGQFWPYHSLIFDNSSLPAPLPLEYASFLTWAQQLELDTDQWATCMNDPATRQEIELDFAAGRTWGITGTPTFFINGQILVGAHPIETFIEFIDRELVALGIEPPTGAGG